MTTIYGIKNCDTMKKAFAWLEGHNIAYMFHDYKKSGADAEILKKAFGAHGWNTAINRAGASWRALPEEIKADVDEQSALALALENPSLIKRPLLVHDGKIHLGFKADQYAAIFRT
jgi:arsenate reductase (glutaredoxin)